MAKVISTGRIELVDLNDNRQLQLFVGSSQPRTQIFNKDNNVLSPNWIASKPILTPQLFIAGTSDNVINNAKSINWYESGDSTPIINGSKYTLGTGNKSLTINKNIVADVKLQFDGVNDYARTDNVIVSSPTALTISGWFKKTGHGNNYECVLHHGRDTSVGATSYWLGIDSTDRLTATIGASTGVGWAGGMTSVIVEYDRWYHLCATWDGANVQVYVDGALEKSYALTSYPDILTPTRLGASSDGSSYQYNGVIGETSIWNKHFLQEEVQNVLMKELSGNETGILSLWKLNEEEGTALSDNAGNSDLTISGATWMSQGRSSKTLICETVYNDAETGFDVIARASIDLVAVDSGQKGDKGLTGKSAVMAVLSNDYHGLPTDSSGDNGDYSQAISTMHLFVGGADTSANWTVTATPSTGITGSLTGQTYSITGMSIDTGTVTFLAKRSGYSDISKVFRVAKSKNGTTGATGDAGESATAYWLIGSAEVLVRGTDGAYTPSSFMVTAKTKIGTASPVNYAGKWRIAESTDGVAYTDKYIGSSNEAMKEYTPSANIHSVRVRMYLQNGTTLVDEQIIPIAHQGKKGEAGKGAVNAVAWTPDGNVIKNSENEITAQLDLYEGSEIVQADDYRWYRQNPNSSAGDYANKHIEEIHDGTFAEGSSKWSSSYSGKTVAQTTMGTGATVDGRSVLRIDGSHWLYSLNPIPVETFKTYEMTFKVKQEIDPTSGGSNVYAGVATLDGDYKAITGGAGTHRYFCATASTVTVASGWKEYTGTITGVGDAHNQFREGTKYVRPMFIVNYSAGNGTTLVDEIAFVDVESRNSSQGWETLDIGRENLLLNSGVEKKGSNEFLRYANIAPIIDKYGLIEYTFSFDIKSENSSSDNTTQMYMQNGSGAKYAFGTPIIVVTNEYVRHSLTVKPSIADSTMTESWLAFYGTYNTGNIPSVKNVKIEIGNGSSNIDWTPAWEEQDIEPNDSNMYGRNYRLKSIPYRNRSDTASISQSADYIYSGDESYIYTATTTELKYLRLSHGITFEANTEYVATCYVYDPNLHTGNYTYIDSNTPVLNTKTITNLGGGYYKYVLNFIPSVSGLPTHGVLLYGSMPVGESIHISGIKVEKGRTPTDWIPAPEDNSALYPTIVNGKDNWIYEHYEDADTTKRNIQYDELKSRTPTYKTIKPDGSNLAYNLGDNYIGYLRSSIYVSKAKSFNISFFHDDNANIFVNGVSVYESAYTGATANTTLKLRSGWNTIEFTYKEGTGGDGISQVSPLISTMVDEMNCHYSLPYGSLRGIDGIEGFNTAEIMIPSNAVVNVDAFKCLTDYNSYIYEDMIVVKDVSDPYGIVILGATVFKNGQGESSFTAKLYRDGYEIDENDDRGYTYKWYIYNSDNSQHSTWDTVGYKTGKTIVVHADDITNEGRLVCEVDA